MIFNVNFTVNLHRYLLPVRFDFHLAIFYDFIQYNDCLFLCLFLLKTLVSIKCKIQIFVTVRI